MRRARDESMADACPCGSSRTYALCCAPLHAHARPASDAESLMRSRYVAFVRGEVEYLWDTLHPDHDDRAQPRESVLAAYEESVRRSRFERLRVLDTAPADRDGVARVLFAVNVRYGDRDASFVECSEFVQVDGAWRYLQGDNAPLRSLATRLGTLRIESFLAWHRAPGTR